MIYGYIKKCPKIYKSHRIIGGSPINYWGECPLAIPHFHRQMDRFRTDTKAWVRLYTITQGPGETLIIYHPYSWPEKIRGFWLGIRVRKSDCSDHMLWDSSSTHVYCLSGHVHARLSIVSSTSQVYPILATRSLSACTPNTSTISRLSAGYTI